MRLAFLLVIALAAACAPRAIKDLSSTNPAERPDVELSAEEIETLPNLGRAPELQNEIWLNIDRPLRLADLRGQVVLLDMWTFG